MRRALVLFVAACHSQTDEPHPLPLPTTQQTATATATATAMATATAPARICEPTTSCGGWSRCTWLEFDHAERGYDVFHIAGSDAGGYGSHFWRMHQCWPADAGPKGCAIYCDAKKVCVDAMSSDGVCTVSRPPSPSPYVCEVRGTECVTLPAKGP